MTPWFESLAVALLAVAGFLLGRWFSRLPKLYWLAGYFIPLLLIALYGLANQYPQLMFTPPISWMMMGRNKFAIIGFLVTIVFSTPLSRLSRKRDRQVIVFLVVVLVLSMSVCPFLAPAFNRGYLAQLKTRVDGDGICLQSNDYNCGPAAAVTALRKLGLPAEEGQIAILAHTSFLIGTDPDVLARTLQKHYGKDGLVAEFRAFKNIGELKDAGLTLVVVKFSFLVDHFLTVLEVGEGKIVVGDPLYGLKTLSTDEFRREWLYEGVVLKRTPGSS